MLHYSAQRFGGLIRHEVAYDGAIVVAAQKTRSLGIGRQGYADAVAAVETLRFIALAVQGTHFAVLESCGKYLMKYVDFIWKR